MMEVSKMEQKQKKASAGNNTSINPASQEQGTASVADPATMQDKTINSIRGKAYEALCGKDGAFSSMFALNPMITGDVVQCLLDFFIVNSDEPHPIDILKNEPSKTIWQSFFDSYNGTTTRSSTNTANATQSFRNMLSTFPSKAKQVMIALDEAGLKNCWTLQKSNKQPDLNEEQIKFIDKFLQAQGVYNSSMDLSSRYKIFKALRGKLPVPETKETK